MVAVAAVLPALATATLGAALVMPLRDDRRGRRATYAGGSPVAAVFAAPVSDSNDSKSTDARPNEHDHEDATRSFQSILSAMLDLGSAASIEDVSFADATSLQHTRADAQVSKVFFVAQSGDASRFTHFLARALAFLSGRRRKKTIDAEVIPRPQSSAVSLDPAEVLAIDAPRFEALAKVVETTSSTVVAGGLAETTCVAHDIVESAAPAETVFASLSSVDLENQVPDSSRDEGGAALIVPQRSIPLPTERVVPLTRRRLHERISGISWPNQLVPTGVFESDEQRHSFLRDLCVAADSTNAAVLELAYLEEAAEDRRSILGALVRIASQTSAATFATALRIGDDDERVAALEGLVRIGRHDELPIAFEDRRTAIAAKAALAFITTREREAFVRRLALFIEPERCERIVALLEGILK